MAGGELFRIIYTSHRPFLQAGADAEAEMHDILEASCSRNQGVGITGALMSTKTSFIQVLEGSAPLLEDTFERICYDMRHHTVELIEFVQVDHRVFPDWSMANLDTDADGLPVFDDAVSDGPASVRLTAAILQYMCGLLRSRMHRAASQVDAAVSNDRSSSEAL